VKEDLSEIQIAAEERDPYPVEGLSKLAQQTVSEVVRFYHVPDTMPAVIDLICHSAAIGPSVKVQSTIDLMLPRSVCDLCDALRSWEERFR